MKQLMVALQTLQYLHVPRKYLHQNNLNQMSKRQQISYEQNVKLNKMRMVALKMANTIAHKEQKQRLS